VTRSSPVLTLRLATAQDRARIRRWLVQPAAVSTGGDAASAEAKISLAMNSEAALCRVIAQAGTPIGYGHAVAVGLWAGPPPGTLPPGAWELELWLGAEQQRGDGRGASRRSAIVGGGGRLAPAPGADRLNAAAEALVLLTAEVFATTLAIACCGLVPITNEAAVRAHERAQFRWHRIWHDPLLGPTWVMLRERPG